MILGLKDGKLVEARGQRPEYKRRPAGEMNSTESAFFLHLQLLCVCGEIASHSCFEPLVLRSGKRRYTPDFKATMKDGTVKVYDCKGTRLTKVKRIPRPWIEPKDRLRIEMFAKEHPQYRFVLVFRYRSQWIEQEIVP